MKNGSGGERLVGSLLIAGAGSTSCGRPDASSGSRGLPRTGNHSPAVHLDSLGPASQTVQV